MPSWTEAPLCKRCLRDVIAGDRADFRPRQHPSVSPAPVVPVGQLTLEQLASGQLELDAIPCEADTGVVFGPKPFDPYDIPF